MTDDRKTQNTVQACPHCGALMADAQKHFEWHIGTSNNEHQLRLVVKDFGLPQPEEART